jgi:hypothetical protein
MRSMTWPVSPRSRSGDGCIPDLTTPLATAGQRFGGAKARSYGNRSERSRVRLPG